MGGYITFGKYDANYKYMLLYAISQLFDQYLFQVDYISELGKFNRRLVSEHKLIQEMYNYLGMVFFSIILLIYENFLKRRKNNSENDMPSIKSDNNYYNIKLIYKDQLKRNISLVKVIIIVFLIVLERQLLVSYYKCGLSGLDFWMFEMLFIYIVSSKIMGDPTYKHQIISVFLVIILCGVMKGFSLGIICFDSSSRIYKKYKILIFIGIVIFLLITYIRAYATCKIKWLMDLKYISSYKLLIIYGLMGAIICCITCIITTFVPCYDTIISFDEMIKICSYNLTFNIDNNNNQTFYYYDNFIVHYETIFNNESLNIFKNIIFIIMKIIVIFLVNLFSILILKYLNPLFFICSRFIYYLIAKLISIIISSIKKEIIPEGTYLDFFSEIFGIFGILVYIELIELNFCNLNYNLKKNIIKRGAEEAINMTEIELDENCKINPDDDSSINTDK